MTRYSSWITVPPKASGITCEKRHRVAAGIRGVRIAREDARLEYSPCERERRQLRIASPNSPRHKCKAGYVGHPRHMHISGDRKHRFWTRAIPAIGSMLAFLFRKKYQAGLGFAEFAYARKRGPD